MPRKKEKRGKITSLRHWPTSERPRERLLQNGARSLSDAELLALFIRSGLPGENARDLALNLLKNSDGLGGLSRRSPADLLRVPGLGPAKVATLTAAFELGTRLLTRKVEGRPCVDSAQTLLNLLRHSLRHEREEIFMGVLLSANNEMIKTITFSRGDPTQVVLSIQQVIRQLLMEGCAAVIFVHNHPSGDPAPSDQDIQLTRRLSEACRAVEITVHDHLIVGNHDFFSFAEERLLGKGNGRKKSSRASSGLLSLPMVIK